MIKPTMMIITSIWGNNKTFRLMRMDLSCPFTEGIYDPDSKVLVLISTEKKQSYHMLAKLDEQGDPLKLKKPRTSPGAKPFPEERKTLETYQEYYITEKKEIEAIVDLLAINKDDVDYKAMMVDKKIIVPEQPKVEIVSP